MVTANPKKEMLVKRYLDLYGRYCFTHLPVWFLWRVTVKAVLAQVLLLWYHLL